MNTRSVRASVRAPRRARPLSAAYRCAGPLSAAYRCAGGEERGGRRTIMTAILMQSMCPPRRADDARGEHRRRGLAQVLLPRPELGRSAGTAEPPRPLPPWH